ncbi:oxysterol-binding protein-related protein 8-like isoform X1 [Daphnia pulex]|uniref:oxysterol-binding protein-related protein 8-like isoform X1 n=1 Tax=Daphnia pulex TaxID=6669 RepID=UPI001EDD699C|nr:oxysterol-binding protein-related protein 8-like isoform X1 [Daphnia pulex]XP_046452708.1 oxysterol-binding protein-related protein 8-like isoform X1 [Daphnia pulex]
MDRSSAEPSPSQPSSPNLYTSTPNKFKIASSSTESAQVPQSVIDRVQCGNETQQLDWQGPGNGESAPSSSPGTVPPAPGFMVARKESYKLQRKNYRFEKKKAANELLCSFKDPAVVVLADWLKVRGMLKSWTKLWCILKPGVILLYKSDKAKDWVGTILLSMCKLIERPSKKDGFCFKLYHPLDQSIWAPKGPLGETIPAPIQPLPTSHLIFRVSSQGAGKCWMDALELALKCSSLLIRSMSTRSTNIGEGLVSDLASGHPISGASASQSGDLHWNDSDFEKHFKDQDFDDTSHTDENDITEAERRSGSGLDVADFATVGPRLPRIRRDSHHSDSESEEDELRSLDDFPVETPYVVQQEEEFGSTGELTEELADDNKSLIWFLVKQVRPGMDLSKVVLPTFILEPRSFLDKLSDYYYHADILSRAVLEDDPFTRMKTVVQWYLSGFYKKPKGLKKPYNPILGEVFRCCWKHPNGSTTFYIAEQVSHHPPISALYVTNRKDGFTLSATILAKSKFYGNSLSALLDGSARLTLLPRGEDYVITMPYAHCKGILLGTLTMEMGGEVYLKCEKTGYRADLEFKLKPMIGGADFMNYVTGKLRLGKETLATISGYWDDCITIEDKRTGEKQTLWNPTSEVRATRLKRWTVASEEQLGYESDKLWSKVAAAIRQENQELATNEKTILEEAQRNATKLRISQNETWMPRCFELDPVTDSWHYRHADVRPWDQRNDVIQYESNFVIATKTRHRTPMIREASIVSVERQTESIRQQLVLSSPNGPEFRKPLSEANVNGASVIRRRNADGSISSSAEGDLLHSSEEDSRLKADKRQLRSGLTSWNHVLQYLEESHRETQDRLTRIQTSIQSMVLQQHQTLGPKKMMRGSSSRDLYLVVLVLVLCQVVLWLYWKK